MVLPIYFHFAGHCDDVPLVSFGLKRQILTPFFLEGSKLLYKIGPKRFFERQASYHFKALECKICKHLILSTLKIRFFIDIL